MSTTATHVRPIPNVPVICTSNPSPGAKIVGYRLVHEKRDGMVCKPDPSHMNTRGWLSVVGALLIFWPVTCVPMCMTCSYTKTYQEPVFE